MYKEKQQCSDSQGKGVRVDRGGQKKENGEGKRLCLG